MLSRRAESYMMPLVPNGFTDAFYLKRCSWQDDHIAAHSMDIAYYFLQDLNHWCSTSFTHWLVVPQALLSCDCTIGSMPHLLGCVSSCPHLIKFTKLTFKKKNIWVAGSQQDPANTLCRCFHLSWCITVNSTTAHQIFICAAQTWKLREGRGDR